MFFPGIGWKSGLLTGPILAADPRPDYRIKKGLYPDSGGPSAVQLPLAPSSLGIGSACVWGNLNIVSSGPYLKSY